jgi:hypothetical protein
MSQPSAYQRVGATRFDVTEAGKADCHYLFCGGAADPRWMQTPTITPGTDKVQVFAGVRKLSDAAAGVLVEHSATTTSNNGAFVVGAPGSAANNYSFTSRGTAAPGFTVTGFAAPISNVLACIGEINSDVSLMRVDGTQAGQNATDQGTGNYLAYPMYIGARGGTSLFFNGEIYALGVRFGPNLDTATIEKVEQYVASLVAEDTI